MKKIIGGPIIINGQELSLSKAVRAGDFVFLTGQIPFKDGEVFTEGSIEEQTKAVIEDIRSTLSEANCTLNDVVVGLSDLSSIISVANISSIVFTLF